MDVNKGDFIHNSNYLKILVTYRYNQYIYVNIKLLWINCRKSTVHHSKLQYTYYANTLDYHHDHLIYIIFLQPVASGILSEFLEVAVHSVLYTRELYPAGVFTRRKKYNVPVQVRVVLYHVLYHEAMYGIILSIIFMMLILMTLDD